MLGEIISTRESLPTALNMAAEGALAGMAETMALEMLEAVEDPPASFMLAHIKVSVVLQ